jgi:folate-dependent phosphoribosylglycinamide formyltransferase PurN
VILESRESRATFLKRRLKHLGPLKVADQLAFHVWGGIARRARKTRLEEIKREFGLDDRAWNDKRVRRVKSANDAETLDLLMRIRPEVVVIHGTRILGRRLLKRIHAPFLNMHTGITPAYRGVHGGYWALASDDAPNCGVTVHLVDAGIDTGPVLAQARVIPSSQDDFFTLPLLQIGTGLPRLVAAVEEALSGRLPPAINAFEQKSDVRDSRPWTHPGLAEYILLWLRKGVH